MEDEQVFRFGPVKEVIRNPRRNYFAAAADPIIKRSVSLAPESAKPIPTSLFVWKNFDVRPELFDFLFFDSQVNPPKFKMMGAEAVADRRLFALAYTTLVHEIRFYHKLRWS
jgi:hypothetical protein